MVKILALNPFGTGSYDQAVFNVLEKAKRPNTELSVDHLTKGPEFFRYWYFKSLATPDIVEHIIRAENEGYQGVYVGCSYEPGVKEAREVVDIPVVGGSVPPVFIARQLGQKFGFITDTELAKVNTYDLFKRYKLDVECVGIEEVELGAEEIPCSQEKARDRVFEVAQGLVNRDADVIVIGCTIIAAFLDIKEDDKPDSLAEIPFLDANVCSLKMLEMLVELYEKCGVHMSRKAYYANPQDKEEEAFQRFRELYGYPNLQSLGKEKEG